MVSVLLLLILSSLSAWSSDSSEQSVIRQDYSRIATQERLTDVTFQATRVLNSINNSGISSCESSPATSIETPIKRYVVVGVSGFGTNEEGNGQPSGAHELLPVMTEIAARYELTHGAKNRRLDEVLENFNCTNRIQGSENLGLIIMANSWGAGKAAKLARRYEQRCGQQVELFIMVDGINKPIPTSYGRRPPSRRCVNYYQDYSTLHGKEIEGCENHNLREACLSGGMANCHITVEWEGARNGAELITRIVLGSN